MDKIVKVGNRFESGHAAGAIISTDGIAPTVMENHGTITKIVDKPICLNSKVNGKQPGLNDRVYDTDGISTAITTFPFFMSNIAEPTIAALRGRNPDRPTDRTKGIQTQQMLEIKDDGTSNTLTTVQKDNMVVEPIALDEQNRFLRKDGTVGTLTTNGSSPKHNNRIVEPSYRIRKQTPRECWRLMGFSDEDFDNASKVNSDSQLYKQAGNSIVVPVLEEIFRRML